ncbi:MAG: hypothetical protein VR75_02260 [Hyphomonadaceae bacterium BRH_c29]|nr:MAG: hypothetical protein VR75_02260 [Hyphomonadaceae bacterium BRH_c29]
MLAFIAREKNSDYSDRALNELYDLALSLRRDMQASEFANVFPYALWRVLGNIDFGAIKREYRNWILDDAETILKRMKDLPPDKWSSLSEETAR